MAPLSFPGAEATPLELRFPGSLTQRSMRASGRLFLLGRLQGSFPRAQAGWGLRGRHPPPGGASLLSAIPTVGREKNQQGPELRAALQAASCLRDSEPVHNLSAGPQAFSGPRISSVKPTGRQAEGCLWEQSLGVNFFL